MAELEIKHRLLMIGGSAGSLSVVLKMLPHIVNDDQMSIVLIFHRKQSDDSTLKDILSHKTTYKVREAEDKDEILPGVIYLAPADYHLLIEKDNTLTLDDSEKINFSRPSIDVSFESAADVFGTNLTCILLSGANADGAEGLRVAKSKGATVIVQDPKTAEVAFMPQQALLHLKPDLIITDENFIEVISSL